MTDNKSEILVGVDGSEPCLRAAEWAAADAAAVGQRVTVCYVSDVSPLADVPLPQDVRRAARAYGHRMVDRALVRIRHTAAVDAAGEVPDGNPAAELIRRAANTERIGADFHTSRLMYLPVMHRVNAAATSAACRGSRWAATADR